MKKSMEKGRQCLCWYLNWELPILLLALLMAAIYVFVGIK